MIYADSSVIVSLLISDSNTSKALKLISTTKSPLIFNPLLRLEVCNAIQLNIANGQLNEVEAIAAEQQIVDLLSKGMWEELEPDWSKVFLRSIGFSKAHTSIIRTRSFDILHVAAALEHGAKEFWSFDKRQRDLAANVGLSVNP